MCAQLRERKRVTGNGRKAENRTGHPVPACLESSVTMNSRLCDAKQRPQQIDTTAPQMDQEQSQRLTKETPFGVYWLLKLEEFNCKILTAVLSGKHRVKIFRERIKH